MIHLNNDEAALLALRCVANDLKSQLRELIAAGEACQSWCVALLRDAQCAVLETEHSNGSVAERVAALTDAVQRAQHVVMVSRDVMEVRL